MEIPENEGKMEGWLYLIGSNRFGLQYSRRRYFILEDNCLKSFKSIPTSQGEEPLRSAIIDSCIRVMDYGRENHHRRVFYIFSLYNTSDHNDQLKLGATSSEEAAKWISSLKNAALNPVTDLSASSSRKWKPFRLSISKKGYQKKVSDGRMLSTHVHAMTSDVIAPSPWKIFGCHNGLRLFKEAKVQDVAGKVWDDHPAIMAVGVVDGSSEAIFRLLMSLGPSRSEWDYCVQKGSVIEHLDGHTDILHAQLYSHWLPWGMNRRDFLLRRYWRREDDGTYVILYHSVVHNKCPPQPGYVRANLKSGGYVVSPVNQGKESVVKHMMAVDWKLWRSYIRKSTARSITIHMLGRVAALRELFRAKRGKYSSEEFISGELTTDIGMPHEVKEEVKTEIGAVKNEVRLDNNEMDRPRSGAPSLVGLNDAPDEFFDVPEPSCEYDHHSDQDWHSNSSPEGNFVEMRTPKLTSAANFVKRLHDLAVQKKGYMDLQETNLESNKSYHYGATLTKDTSNSMPSSFAEGQTCLFLIRGPNYLEDNQKIKAKETLMQMVGADWIRSETREDDLAGRPGSIVQKYAAQGGPEFFFIINIQVPGTPRYNLAFYYMLNTPLEETPLLERFVEGDDAFRNSRFKLIPYISKGPWIVKQSVGKKACLVGQALEVNYFRGTNYLEIGVDVGSSTVARGVVSLVLGYLNNLIIEMAFLIQGNTEEELPEILLGTCRLNHLDAAKAVPVESIAS